MLPYLVQITAYKEIIRPISNLTNEVQVLKLIGDGSSSMYISKKLELSTSTVETHRKNIRKKLKLVGKGKLIEFAILYNLKHPNK